MRRVWIAPFLALAAVFASAAIVLADGRTSRVTGVAAAHHVPKPRIVWDPIPFGSKRKAETAAYVRRHYGSFMKPTWRLSTRT